MASIRLWCVGVQGGRELGICGLGFGPRDSVGLRPSERQNRTFPRVYGPAQPVLTSRRVAGVPLCISKFCQVVLGVPSSGYSELQPKAVCSLMFALFRTVKDKDRVTTTVLCPTSGTLNGTQVEGFEKCRTVFDFAARTWYNCTAAQPCPQEDILYGCTENESAENNQAMPRIQTKKFAKKRIRSQTMECGEQSLAVEDRQRQAVPSVLHERTCCKLGAWQM